MKPVLHMKRGLAHDLMFCCDVACVHQRSQADAAALLRFKAAFAADMARNLGVAASAVQVKDVRQGSVVVDFEVQAEDDASSEAAAAVYTKAVSDNTLSLDTVVAVTPADAKKSGSGDAFSVQSAAPNAGDGGGAGSGGGGTGSNDDDDSTSTIIIVVAVVGGLLVIGVIAALVIVQKKKSKGRGDNRVKHASPKAVRPNNNQDMTNPEHI